MHSRWARLLPALFVTSLLAAAAVVPTQRVRARSGFENNAYIYPRCDLLLQWGGGDTTMPLVTSAGVTQPIAPIVNVAACSVGVVVNPFAYGNAQMDIVEWDPLTLAPSAGMLALRSRSFDPTAVAYGQTRLDLVPPIVTRTALHLADPPGSRLAINFRTVSSGGNPITLSFQREGAPQTPIAYTYLGSSARVPLSGAHSILSHKVCGGDAALQELFVTQSVATTDVALGAGVYEFLQSFRVPIATDLKWIELAFGSQTGSPGVISIHDAGSTTSPPAHIPAALAESYFTAGYAPPSWGSHFDFDNSVTLQPNHTYWLVVRTAYDYNLYTRTATGSESPDFVNGIGGLWTRGLPTVTWSASPGRALSFKVIGVPLSPVDVAPIAPAPSSLRLQIHPNPARGPVFVRWSGARGARGALRFDVLDARGRRMASGLGDPGAEGRWVWRASYDDGRALPAGVYFVRATDADGQRAVERVALVR